MRKDESWKKFFGDNERYADLINGIGCDGVQYVKPADLQELDTASKKKARDLLRKTAFGMNFAIIGIENQEEVDYKFPLRNLHYEVNQYEKQATEVRREIRGNRKKVLDTNLRPGEYMYGFKKDSRLHPVITFVIYAGKEPWDGPMSLHDIIDFKDIPEKLRKLAANYSINLIDIRRMKDTRIFKTDVRYVFDFIRYAEDKNTLFDLVTKEPYYQEMDEEAFEVVSNYTNLEGLVKNNEEERGGKKDVCKAIIDLMEDSRIEGIEVGMARGAEQTKLENARNLIGLLSDEIIAEKIGLPLEKVKELHVQAMV